MARHVNVVAHRGASHDRPENTIPAFEYALELGVDLLEFDVRLTADGHAVVIHDATVDRTTNGSGAIQDLTLGEIQELDAGLYLDAEYEGTIIPTLDEVLDTARSSGVGLDVQIYALDDTMPQLTKQVVDSLINHGYDERAFIASEEDVVHLARELDPNRPICNLTGQRDSGTVDRNHEIGSTIVQAVAKYVTPELVEYAHGFGITMNVFYADDIDEMNRLITCGVDGILTNESGLLLRTLGRDPSLT
jgi:glycerophosphoryl diester phosphodiesterase